MADQRARKILVRLTNIRAGLLLKYPFFGFLAMHLKLGLAACETAFTDQRRIVFDPDFVERLSDDEVEFVMNHEIMHCVLNHCRRGRGYEHEIFNVACDIVVNSNILQVMRKNEVSVDGYSAMHLTPDGQEGYLYSAEEVYQMLMQGQPGDGSSGWNISKDADRHMDRHDLWDHLDPATADVQIWKDYTKEAEASAGGQDGCPESCPPGVRKLLERWNGSRELNWRELVRQFVQVHYDNFDYTFCPPDRRFSEGDFILPFFQECENPVPENLWFCCDTSASVSDQLLTRCLGEIEQAIYQFPGLSGYLSFFDTGITEPKPFSNLKELRKITTLGGGGTNFGVIFGYLQQYMQDKPPAAIIILTDGFAAFPPDTAAMGIPVLWIIADEGPEPNWGTVAKIHSS